MRFANQRTRADLADGTYWVYDYDSLGQVKAGKRYWNDGTLMDGQNFDYKFDDIGNRDTTGGRASAVSDYTANQLNQYTTRTVANKLDVLGIANPTAGVEVWKDSDSHTTANRKGEYFHYSLTVSNDSYPLLNAKSLYGATQTAAIGRSYVPPATESYTYDTDGNLTADGRWTTYVWDGENRLIEMRRDTSTPTEARQKLTFEYDHLGRRIRKTYFTYSGGWVEQRDTTYLYDGWNMVVEADANNSNATLRTYVWGTDLSGNRTGAGGVGGLLWVNNAQTGLTAGIQFAAYDGNGNVAGLFAASDGSNTARYEYGPFGESLRMTGTLAKANPVRWSTKVSDDEGGLVYYGYRYYNSSTGRWISRDLINERGGVHLLAIVRNSTVNGFDTLGLQPGIDFGITIGNWSYNGSFSVNGFTMGAQGLFGLQPDLDFGPDDSATSDMQRSRTVGIDRDRVRAELRKHCKGGGGNGPVIVNLGNELPQISTSAYPFLFVLDLFLNNTAAFTGSWSGGTVTATRIDCCRHTANLHFDAFNISGMTSASHKPPKDNNYVGSLFGPNPFGKNGPMSDFRQSYEWDESISF